MLELIDSPEVILMRLSMEHGDDRGVWRDRSKVKRKPKPTTKKEKKKFNGSVSLGHATLLGRT
jgi:hypothetical protein